MFPTFISILDIQSWWEVPSIAHFCSLFRSAFNLLDFDIEDLEEALLTDGTEETSWLQELIVRLLSGCLPNNEISTFNYQMFLRRLFRQKCQEHDRYNPFNTDVDFTLLPLRTKVDILYALCDFRLDAEDVLDQLKNLEADSLRVEPLGFDSNESAYWYFYGTRLYREDFKTKNNKKKCIWQVICFSEDDWFHLTKKFKKSGCKTERQLYQTLCENFLPELPRLFREKERLARKRLLDNQPRRTSNRLRKTDFPEKENVELTKDIKVVGKDDQRKKELESKRREAYERRTKLKEEAVDSQTEISETVDSMAAEKTEKKIKRRQTKTLKENEDEVPKKVNSNKQDKSNAAKHTVGRQTNNSLSAVQGQIVIESFSNHQRKKLKTTQTYCQTLEDLQTGLHKILEYVKNHDDAWPFTEPVEEEYAPNYYSVIRKPMDLQRMEERLESGFYKNFSKFRADFQLIVDNCRLYNGIENEYTEMANNLLNEFQTASEKYLDQTTSSEDEVAVEYPKIQNKSVEIKNEKNDATVVSKRKPTLAAMTDKKKEITHSDSSDDMMDDLNECRELPIAKLEKSNKSTDKHIKKHSKAKVIPEPKLTDNPKRNSKHVDSKETKNEKHSSISKKVNHNKSITKINKENTKESPCTSRSPSTPENCPPKRYPQKRKEYYSSEEEDYLKSKGKENRLNDDHGRDEKKQKSEKPNCSIPKPKDKHNKLWETIEKLKAKNEIVLKTDEPENVVKPNKDKQHGEHHLPKRKDKVVKSEVIKEDHKISDNTQTDNSSSQNKLSTKNQFTKSMELEALTLATEQTLKDINKWLDDTPRLSEFSSASNSPSYVSIEDFDISNKSEQDQRKKLDKPLLKKDVLGKEIKRKQTHREPSKLFKRRDIQRTIDRLQPGKSKGNLITSVQNSVKSEELFLMGAITKAKDLKNSLIVKTNNNAPKLSLGTVLDSFGKHKFVDDQKREQINTTKIRTLEQPFKVLSSVEPKSEDKNKENVEKNMENIKDVTPKANNDGTPNLSAWFKAFGAPKIQSLPKKADAKSEIKENENGEDEIKSETKGKEDLQNKVPLSQASPNCESLLPGQAGTRQRKISTGSSVSERSSFSQDLDSPRVGIDERLGAYPAPYPSPLHRSPSGASPILASPQPDVSPRATAYPTINGQIRVGFYQDTVSNKSSPDKSCSPKEPPHSPYPLHSEHVYTTTSTKPLPYSYASSPYYSHANSTPPYKMEVANPQLFYDTNKSLVNQYQEKMNLSNDGNPSQDFSRPPTVINPPQEVDYDRQQIRTFEKPTIQPSIFPMKKRICSEAESVTSNQNRMDDEYSRTDPHYNINQHPQSVAKVVEESIGSEIKETQKQVHNQNIPNLQSNSNNIPKIPNPHTMINLPTHPQSHTDNMNLRNINYPAPIAAFGDSFTTEFNYPLTVPRKLQDTERKADMSKYTNMGYAGPEAAFARSLQQYNMTEAGYMQSLPITTGVQPSVSSNQISQASDMRYSMSNNVLTPLDYKDIGQKHNQQVHNYNTHPHDQTTQNSLENVPNRFLTASGDLPSNYKSSEVPVERTTYNTSLDIEQSLGLRGNLTNLPHMVDRFNDRLSSDSSYYTEKSMSGGHIFNKHNPTSSSSMPIFSSPNIAMTTFNQTIQQASTMCTNRQVDDLQNPNSNTAELLIPQPLEKKVKKRKNSKTASTVSAIESQQSNQGFQSYAGLKNKAMAPSAISLKTTSVVPGSAFNFGPTATNLTGLYDKETYPSFLEEYRATPNYYMAAAATHSRSTPDSNDNQQSTTPQPPGYPFLTTPQSRPNYPLGRSFISPTQSQLMDPNSPLYQHYLQSGVLNQGLLAPPGSYPPGYHHPLSMRQPYDPMTRPTWL